MMLNPKKKKTMADSGKLLPFILKWEGGFVNDPHDSGGATNKGVTIGTWKKCGYDKDGDGDIDVQDLKLLSVDDVRNRVFVPFYWNRWKADRIQSQKVANILVDWVWCSGAHGIKIPQRILGVVDDGIVGNKTISAVNFADPDDLFNALFNARAKFFGDIVKRNPSQKRFLKGWLNRLNDIKNLK